MNFRIKHLFLKSDKIFLILLIAWLLPNASKSQSDTFPDHYQFDKKYLISYWQDSKTIIAEPLHWKLKQWSIFTGIIGVSVITYIYDKEISDFFQKNSSEASEKISKYAIEPWGSGLYSLPLLTGIYLTSNKNEYHRNVALTGLKAYILSGGVSVITKYIFHRHRPGDDDPPNPYLWEGPFEFTKDYTSFPSGHTATAFAIASVLTHGYKGKTWIGLASYSLATLVGLSRIHDGEHWATDVIAGAVIGTFIGTTLSKINFRRDRNLVFAPISIKGSFGLSIVYLLK